VSNATINYNAVNVIKNGMSIKIIALTIVQINSIRVIFLIKNKFQ